MLKSMFFMCFMAVGGAAAISGGNLFHLGLDSAQIKRFLQHFDGGGRAELRGDFFILVYFNSGVALFLYHRSGGTF